MNRLPPADLEKLVSAQQLAVGSIRSANHVSRQTNRAPGQLPSLREGKVECNNNLKSSDAEDGRYPQGVGPRRCFDFQKEGYLANCERRNIIEQEGCTNMDHVCHEMDRRVGEEKHSGYNKNVLSNGWTMEDGGQTDDRGSINQDGCSSFYSSLSSSASFNTENPSLLALSNLSTATTAQCSHPLVSHQTPSPPPSLPPSLPPQPLKPGSSTLRASERKILQEHACKYPDTIVWSRNTMKCDVPWNEEGRLSFTVLDKMSKDGSEIYAMVTSMQRGSPAHEKGLRPGDLVLSINRTEVHRKQTKERAMGMSTTQIFRQQSHDSPVTIIFQRPKGILKRENTPSATSELSSLEGMCSQGSFRNDDAPMARLPDLRLVIMGSSAENTAEQLVGSKIWSERQDGPISTRCCMNIRKRNNIFEYLPVKSHQVIDNLKLLDSQKTCLVGSNDITDSSAVSECVVLEVIVLKNSRLAEYCSQLVMTSHCMYIIGFDGQSFLENTEKHVRELQGQLNKIRTYAGSESPVYLVSAWQHLSAVTLESIEDIGMHLHQRFGVAFRVQLQYHGNCPCFMLNRVSLQRQSSSPVPLLKQHQHPGEGKVDLTVTQDQGGSSVTKFSTQNSTSTSSSSSSDPMSMFSGCTCFSEFGPEACLTFLRDHIAKNVFEQSFVKMKTYPQKFLCYREIVIGLRDQKQKCVMTSGVKKACGISDSAELTSLLEYLHRQGVIIVSDNEKDTPNHSFVALNPEDLIHTCMRLLVVPDKSHQDQSFRYHWSLLQKESILTPALLTHLLGMESDAACITACLKQLNLIHDYSGLPSGHLFCDSLQVERRSTQQALYLMPFYIKKLVPRGTVHGQDLSWERMLLADFKGYCPHGLFSKIAIGLARLITGEMLGTFELESETSWVFNKGGNYTLYMSDDLGRCIVKFAVMCKVGFPLQNVLNDIHTAIMKVATSDHCFTLGPPCPLDQRCKFQQEPSHLSVPHIIDLSKECPLSCGNEDVGKFRRVNQWIVSSGKQMRGSPQVNTAGRILHRDMPFSDFPADLLLLICSKLNLHCHRSRDYRGLAGELGYTISDLKCFEEASLPHQHRFHYDPCRHLLEDWGKSPNATLGNLIDVLKQPNLNRQDVITEITRKWTLTDK